MVSLSGRIKAVREAIGLSQQEFGERLGVGCDVISNIELNRAPLKEPFMQRICEAYYINRHWLETGEGEMFDCDPVKAGRLAEICRLYELLQPDFQGYALDQMRSMYELQKELLGTSD